MRIRIIATPPGEAPEEVRAAWGGLALPMATPGPLTIPTFGVLSGPKPWPASLLARLLGRVNQEHGYAVDAHRAVEILAARAPEAARWWRQNAAGIVRPGKYFLFAAEACEEITSWRP